MKKKLSSVISGLSLWVVLSILPSVAFSQCLQDKTTTAQAFVTNFYRWYSTTQGFTDYPKKSTCFAPEFLAALDKVVKGEASCEGEAILDYDPFGSTNAFEPKEISAKTTKDEVVDGKTQVSVDLHYKGDAEVHHLKIELVKNPFWQISDILEPDSTIPQNRRLTEVLKLLNKEVEECLSQKAAHGSAMKKK